MTNRQHRHLPSPHIMQLALIILLGFFLRLYRLGKQSLWYDETVSAYLASQPIIELIAHTARDIHPPGYYLLLHFWTIIAGASEFALAFFSVVFGLLLIPATYRLALILSTKRVATLSALLVATSPYNLWYSQEVRMYTLGAFLGVVATYCALQAQRINKNSHQRLFWAGYLLASAIALYTLYYFSFLLIILNLFLLYQAVVSTPSRSSKALRARPNIGLLQLIGVNILLIILYLPWIPTAWKQATNPPVPPWRTPNAIGSTLLESWSALSLGQSVEPTTIWPILLLTLALVFFGFYHLLQISSFSNFKSANLPIFLVAYTFGPLLLILLFSIITPLYHVRYIFTYSPAYYILLGAGLAWLISERRFWVGGVALILMLSASLFSIYQLHFSSANHSDDYRSAVAFIQSHWQPGDIIVMNAGYTYTAFLYYTDFPHINRARLTPYQPPSTPSLPQLIQTGTVDGPSTLGWGDPRSDFYAMSAADTIAALDQRSTDFSRLWMLRAYDTVTDPNAIIRSWLDDYTILIEDQPFSGQSHIRVQGFLLNQDPDLEGETIQFEDGIQLDGWTLPNQSWKAGDTIHLKLAWLATGQPTVDYKMSLKLWSNEGNLAAQGIDEWPVGSLYRPTQWHLKQTVYHPTQITLPPDIIPGQYWLNIELYHPDTIQPLSRLDDEAPVVTLGSVIIQ
ncbi:MAG: glycosyltransferase family 39 protein [Chloroflexota bacterium]